MGLEMSVRERAAAVVGLLGAAGGFVAGAIGALAAVSVLTPTGPVSIGMKALMVLEYGLSGAFFGAVLGTAIAFAALRRVPLGRIVAFGTIGGAIGTTCGWVGGFWAWHHFTTLGVGGMVVGALASRLVGEARPASDPDALRYVDTAARDLPQPRHIDLVSPHARQSTHRDSA